MTTRSIMAGWVLGAVLSAGAGAQEAPPDSESETSFTEPAIYTEPEDDRAPAIGDAGESWSLRRIRERDFTVYWDNDGTVPNLIDNTDRYYTNGVGLELSLDLNLTQSLKDRLAPQGEWDNPRFGAGVAIKQLIFTGVDITDPDPPADDHPYSGYLYLALSFQRADDEKHDHFELDIGVIGERSQAEAVQRLIHRNFPDEEDPQGWSHQLANEIAINFTYERTWKSRAGEIRGVEFEMLPALGFDLGNVSIRGKANMTLRAGMNLPRDFGPPSLLGHKDHTVSAADWGEGDLSFYVYARAGVDAVAHSIFLDGNTFADSRSVDSEPFVATGTLGAVVRYKCAYLGWSQSFQTETFEGQTDQQTFGSIVLGLSLNY